MSVSEGQPEILGYAAQRRRRWTRRSLIALATVLSLSGVLIWLGRPWWQQGTYLLWQRRLMNFAQPVETIVYEEDPKAAAAIVARSTQHIPIPDSPFAAARWPEPLGVLIPQAYETSGRACIAFLHHRRSPAGHDRLIVLPFNIWGTDSDFQNRDFLRYFDPSFTFVPATWTRGSRITSTPFPTFSWHADADRPYGLRLFAGQPDAGDLSHFTITYEAKMTVDSRWERGIIDGWLRDDDAVDLKVRDGPLRLSRQ